MAWLKCHDKLRMLIAVSQMRRTEILYVLVIDMVYFRVFPNPTGVAGYLLVFCSVVGMSAADKVQAWINDFSFCAKVRSMFIVNQHDPDSDEE